MIHTEHDRLIDEKLHRRTEFGVRHFAGPVTYDSTKFVERNTDKLADDLIHCAALSTNEMIREEFEHLISAQEKTESSGIPKKKKHRTVLEKFRVQLKSLMANMEGTTTRYIRCIKPNETHTPRVTDHYHTMRQLECAGLVTAIAISRESFPNRLGYDSIRDRFECLMNQRDMKNVQGMSKRDTVNYMLSNLLPSMAEMHGGTNLTLPFACGKTRVYFRAGALEHLETMRLDYYTGHTVVIQRWIRKIHARCHFMRMKETAVKMQALARCRIESQHYRRQKAAVLSLQCWCRGEKAKGTMKELRFIRSVIKIQSRQVLCSLSCPCYSTF
jgi:myosin heavy subunit